jgi:hypothetical protein
MYSAPYQHKPLYDLSVRGLFAALRDHIKPEVAKVRAINFGRQAH